MENLLRSDRGRLGMGNVRTREDFPLEREGTFRSFDARLREYLLRAHLPLSPRRTSDSLRAAWLPGLLQGAPIHLRPRLRSLHPEQGDRSVLSASLGPLPPLGEQTIEVIRSAKLEENCCLRRDRRGRGGDTALDIRLGVSAFHELISLRSARSGCQPGGECDYHHDKDDHDALRLRYKPNTEHPVLLHVPVLSGGLRTSKRLELLSLELDSTYRRESSAIFRQHCHSQDLTSKRDGYEPDPVSPHRLAGDGQSGGLVLHLADRPRDRLEVTEEEGGRG